MGNQLTGIAPSQILPVEHYLTDNVDYEYDVSLGSTRFFKVARARYKEGLVVVKVFVIHDPSLPLVTYQHKIEKYREELSQASNCLPFQKTMLSDKAAFLCRMYVKDSLYDRISTRPFLNAIEKKWIAFQLLCALNQCHKKNVCHGDVKSENVMVTGWNWLLLTDFASFKPTYVPEDNPADFSYFFDTSRRRTCNLSPERFVESSWRNSEAKERADMDLTASEVKKGDLTPAMDIFAAGCVIAELLTEGTPVFDLSQLLSYRSGEFSPWKLLEKIEDSHMREMVRHMMQKEPQHRLSAEEYLVQQRNKAFPEYFYTFLKLYLQRFATAPILPSDDKIARVKRDLPVILKNLDIDETEPQNNTVLVLVISLVTASISSLHYCKSKLTALEVMLSLSKFVTADIILDRLVPFMLHLVTDTYPAVRAEAIHTLTQCLASVNKVPISDANIFPEYILPQMSHLSQDAVVKVRVAYAENIALLAETALRFLEIVQLNHSADGPVEEDSQDSMQYKASYDAELQALHEMIQQKVVTLLSDPDNIVKHTLLETGITRLCVFFGRQKANDVLLSHMITFLNDKYDWYLRGAFFDSIVGVAAYVGWQSSSILKPLLEQGLSDVEEFVIHKTLSALTSLTELGLLQKPTLHDLLADVVPFFCHPGVWIRQGAVGFVSSVARILNIADVHCNLLPLIQPFLKQPVIQVDSEVVLLTALEDPVPRTIYDYIVRSPLIDRLFECLQDRQLIRNICRHGHAPNYTEIDDSLSQMMRKLISQGMTEADEDKLLAMKEFVLKLHRSRAGSAETSGLEEEEEDVQRHGSLNLAVLGKALTRRHADLIIADGVKVDGQQTPTKKVVKKKTGTPDSPTVSMNEDWKQMFGSHHDPDRPQGSAVQKLKLQAAENNAGGRPATGAAVPTTAGQVAPAVPTPTGGNNLTNHQNLERNRSTQSLHNLPDRSAVQTRYASCKFELHHLVSRKREQYSTDQITKDLLDSATWENRPPPAGWRPKGQLVAHLHEHRGAVNRIQVSPDCAFFATCSNDGTVKIWDCSRMEGKSVTNRSRQTYNKQGGQIKTIAFCEQSYSIAAASDSGAIHVFRIESSSPRISILHTKNLDVEEEGLVVDMTHFDTGAQSVLAYATVHGLLVGWDLRAPRVAWQLKNDSKLGLITSFSVHALQSWLSVGTSSGSQVCWDLRFQLPITTVTHPTGARVRRLVAHPGEQSWIISAVQGNNEVSMWDMETGARQKTMWASSAPPLSLTQASGHTANGMHLGMTDSNTFLLTAGSDMRIRYWDLSYPANSHIVAHAATDPLNQTVVSYRSRLIDGTEVIQETYSKARTPASEDIPRRGPDTPPSGHHDVITDINICQTSQCFIISASRDGVVKVWK